MIGSLSDSALKSLRSLEKELTKAIRLDAYRAKWPKPIASSLSVSIKNNELVVTYPDAYEEQVGDLEYGTQSSSPRPVFRTFVNRHQAKLTQNLEQWLVDKLAEMEALP